MLKEYEDASGHPPPPTIIVSLADAIPTSLTHDWGWVDEDESIFCPGGEWWGDISLFFIVIIANVI